MAVGFPVKADYSTGDVLTAAQMNDLSGTLNYLDPTAKGDLFPASSGTALTRLAVGANGETLVADSSTSTGLRYTAGTVQSNPVLNSAMQIWQRGTSAATWSGGLTGYGPDRWQLLRGAAFSGATVSRQVTGDTTNLPNIQFCARVQRDSGVSTTTSISLTQSFESINSIPYAGKTVTLSFYARAGANYSSASNALGVILYTGTGTDQVALITPYSGPATPISQTATLTSTWQRFQYTGTISTTATEISPSFGYTPVGTAGAADFYEITGVQIDVGSVALPFRTNGATIQTELAACQRYYWRTGGLSGYQQLGTAYAKSATEVNLVIPNPVPMRVIPTSVDSSTLGFQEYGGTIRTMSAVTLDGSSSPTASLIYGTIAGSTAGFVGRVLVNNSTSGFLGFSAEL
jgi:hypothetical protein